MLRAQGEEEEQALPLGKSTVHVTQKVTSGNLTGPKPEAEEELGLSRSTPASASLGGVREAESVHF